MLLGQTIDKSEIRRSVLSLAWPSILENLLQSVLGLVTILMVARLGASAVAAVGSSMQLQILFISAFFALSMGTTVLAAHAYGAGRIDMADMIAKQSVVAGVTLSVVFTAIVMLFATPMIQWLGAEPDVVADGARFMRWSAISFVFMAVMFILGGVLRGIGDTRTPMLVTVGINFINVAIAPALIFGLAGLPRMEIDGAALAMIISRAAGGIVMAALLLRGWRGVSIAGRHDWLPNRVHLKRLADIGLPSMAESLLRSGGQILFIVIVFMLGTTVNAAFQIAQNAMFLSMFPGFGFAMAATALVGQSLGAQNVPRARAVTATATRACLVWMSAMGVLFFVFARPIMELGAASGAEHDEIVRVGAAALMIIAFAQPFQAIGFALAGALRGAGDTRWPMYSTAISMWLFRLPLAYLFAITLDLGLPGVFIAMTLDTFILMMMNLWRYRQGKWAERRVLTDAVDRPRSEPSEPAEAIPADG
jgi:putative MATE family efflux protein